jgi:glycopeptide antibiotics resistance protein
MVLPINREGSLLNDIYIIHIRLDYLAHLVVFLPFLFLFRKVYAYGLIPALFIGCLFAALSEILQYILPYRAFNINDLLGNVFGVVAGLVLLIPTVNSLLSKVVPFMKKE